MSLLDRLLKQLLDEHLVVSGVWQDERIEALITEYTQAVLAEAQASVETPEVVHLGSATAIEVSAENQALAFPAYSKDTPDAQG